MKKLLFSFALIFLFILGFVNRSIACDQCIEQGATGTLCVQFVDSDWLGIASTSKEARIYDSSGALDTTVTDGSFTALDGTNSIGLYTASLTVGGADPKGAWPISWKGTNGGVERTGLDSIEVRGVSECGSTNDDILADVTGLNGDVMRGTDSAATASALVTAQADLDTITGTDGTTLATTQGNYAPAKAGDSMALTAAAVDSILDEGIEGIYSLREAICIAVSALSGKLSTTGLTATFRGLEDSENRATVTFASGGNRSAVTFDLTGCQ